MGLFDYHCAWCGKSFPGMLIEKVEWRGNGSRTNDMLRCLDFDLPRYSVRKFGHFLCVHCARDYKEVLQKIDYAWSNKNDVELVSANYHGKKRYESGTEVELSTTWERDWDYARELLKALAAYYGCDMVIKVEKATDTWKEPSESGKGTHYYKVVSFSGIAVRKK